MADTHATAPTHDGPPPCEMDVLEMQLCRAKARNAELTDALQCLYDEQQGPPLELPRHKASWQAAMDKARALLEASNG